MFLKSLPVLCSSSSIIMEEDDEQADDVEPDEFEEDV